MSDKLYLIISDKSRFKAVSWGPAYIRMDRNLLILSNSHPGVGNAKASICSDKAYLFVCLQRNDCSGQRLMWEGELLGALQTQALQTERLSMAFHNFLLMLFSIAKAFGLLLGRWNEMISVGDKRKQMNSFTKILRASILLYSYFSEVGIGKYTK